MPALPGRAGGDGVKALALVILLLLASCDGISFGSTCESGAVNGEPYIACEGAP